MSFENENLNIDNYQGSAAINYTDAKTPFTQVIEHKHFEFGEQEKSIITRGYPQTWNKGDEPYYPVNDEKQFIV